MYLITEPVTPGVYETRDAQVVDIHCIKRGGDYPALGWIVRTPAEGRLNKPIEARWNMRGEPESGRSELHLQKRLGDELEGKDIPDAVLNGRADDARWRAYAQKRAAGLGEDVIVDDQGEVNTTLAGAYVQAWIWVEGPLCPECWQPNRGTPEYQGLCEQCLSLPVENGEVV